jgi:hypothetical protein
MFISGVELVAKAIATTVAETAAVVAIFNYAAAKDRTTMVAMLGSKAGMPLSITVPQRAMVDLWKSPEAMLSIMMALFLIRPRAAMLESQVVVLTQQPHSLELYR